MAANHGIVEGILHIGPRIGHSEEPSSVRLVLGEEESRGPGTLIQVPPAIPEVPVGRADHARAFPPKHWTFRGVPPRPGVAIPGVRQDVEFGGLGTSVRGGDRAEDVFLVGLGILDHDVEITPLGQGVADGVDQLELGLGTASRTVLGHQPLVRVSDLGIPVEHAHVRMAREPILVIVIFLHILAVVALFVGETEEAFLQEGIAAVPEGWSQAEVLKAIAEAGEAILVPAVGAAAGLVVREVVPGIAVGAVVLAHGAPGAFGEVRAPVLPVGVAVGAIAQATVLGGRRVGQGQDLPVATDPGIRDRPVWRFAASLAYGPAHGGPVPSCLHDITARPQSRDAMIISPGGARRIRTGSARAARRPAPGLP